MIHVLRLLSLCSLQILIVAGLAWAQGMSVTGRVVDPQGGAIGNAQVTVSGQGQPRTVRSTADGAFSIGSVAAGTYTLTVQAPGFAAATQSVSVNAAGASTGLTIAMRVEGVSEDVTVQGALIGTVATGKTTVPLRELPITVNAVPAELIQEQGANDLVAALRNVPGVYSFTTYGVYEYYSFRGFLDSVQLVDGVRNEGNRINTQLTNVDRIEVLKGPSSALYGGAALGATVNLIRKKPSSAPAYDFVASAGSWKLGRGAFGATGRFGSDAALYRLDVGAETSDGYRHNDATRVTVTPSLAWRIGAANQVNIYYTFNRDRFAGDAGLPLIDTGLGVPVEDNVPDVPRDRNYRTPYDHATSLDHNLQIAYARQLTNAVGFRNTLSYRHFDDEYFLSEEVDFAPPTGLDRYYLYFKHHWRPLTNIAELTARSTRGIEQDFFAGWEAQRHHDHATLPEEDFFAAESIDLYRPVETQGPSDLTITRQNVFTNNTNAFYLQDHLTLGPKVKVLLGGRFDVYRRQTHVDPIANDTVTSEGPVSRREAEAFTSRAGLVYQPIPTVDLYGSFANSFKPLNVVQPDGSSLDPETGSQFEFGQRFHMAADRVQLNTAVYRILRQNVAFRRPGNIYVQAGEVQSRGFEADLQTALGSRWRVTAGYGFTDAEFLDYQETLTSNLRGNTPVFAPRHTFNLWTGYQFDNGLGVNLGARYFGEVFADNANTFTVDGYSVLSLAVRYSHGPVEYAVNVNNLTDTKYFVPHLDYLQVYPGDPVAVLGTIRLRFK